MDNNQDHSLLRNNPIFVICIACALAAIMMSVSILSYIRSDTRKTIEQIQANNNTLRQDPSVITLTGDLTPTLITSTKKSIVKDIESHDEDTDFSPDELTDSALGL